MAWTTATMRPSAATSGRTGSVGYPLGCDSSLIGSTLNDHRVDITGVWTGELSDTYDKKFAESERLVDDSTTTLRSALTFTYVDAPFAGRSTE